MKNSKHTSEIIYDNCPVYSMDGDIISYTTKSKASKLVLKGIAEVVSENPYAVKFLIEREIRTPKELIVPRDNICVVCGTDKDLTRHHVIPNEYIKHIEFKFKNHNYGNVLAVCCHCHQNYEKYASELKNELALKYNAPIKINKTHHEIYKLSSSIFYKKNEIPIDKLMILYERLSDITNTPLKNLTDDMLNNFMEKYHRKNRKKHSKIVMENVDVKDFIRIWKQHFLDYAKPKYLPDFWHYYFLKE